MTMAILIEDPDDPRLTAFRDVRGRDLTGREGRFIAEGAVVLGVLAFIYLAYLAALLFYFLLYVVTVSERPRDDVWYLCFLPLFPRFAFVNRIHCSFSSMAEMFMKSHLDSSMAPWWVLRKTKF